MSGLNNKKYLDGDGLIKFWKICCANFPAKDGRGATGNWNIKAATAGVADDAIKLKVARNIAIAGAVTGSADFDGSTNITITTGVNHTHNKLHHLGRLESANLTHTGDGTLLHFKVTSAMTDGRPMSDGNILHFEWDTWANWASQLYIPIANGAFPQWRKQGNSTDGSWLDWDTFLTTGNYSTYALPLSGGTLTGNITAPTFIGALQGNAATATTATTLQTTRKIWGQNFNGGADVSGDMTGVGKITSSDNGYTTEIKNGDIVVTSTTNGGWARGLYYKHNLSEDPAICVSGVVGDTSQMSYCYYGGNYSAGQHAMRLYDANNDYKAVFTGNVTAPKFIGALEGNVTGNVSGSASTATTMSSFGVAAADATKRYVWMSWNDNTGKPAYTDKLTFQTSTNTLFSDKFVGNLTGDVIGNLTGNATSATTATNLANKPALTTSGTTQITVTAGEKTSDPFTVPYATTAGTAEKTGGTLTLKTPAETITFNGSANKTFEVTAAKLGLTKAVLYLGKSTTAITDGGTEKPTIDGSVVNTLTAGNIVIDSADSREYIWNGSKWEKFGLDGDAASGNYKPIQAVVGDPTADGNATAFIDAISQDANGKITVTKKNVNFSGYATTAQLGNYLPLAGGTMNSTAYIAWNSGADGNDISDWNTITGNGLRIISSTTTNANAPTQYSTALHVKGRYGFQIAGAGGVNNTFYIRNIDAGANSWYRIIHSGNIGSSNAGSATQLATARNIWGQSFDGTMNVTGNMTGVGKINTVLLADAGTGNATLNVSCVSANMDYVHAYVSSNTGTNTNTRPLVLQNGYGNVGIGVIAPSEKLEVSGNVKATKFIGALQGNADTATYATSLSSFDAASSTSTKRYVWMSYDDNSAKPAYSSKLTFQTSTNTLFVNDKAVSLSGHTHNFADLSNHMVATNEFNFVPNGYNSDVYFNYRAVGGTGTVNAYRFTNGAGTGGYAPCYATNFITTSDRRMKENIVELQDCSKSLELGFYEFDYKTGGHSAGHIAQDVRGVYPAFVHGEETEKDNLSVDYNALHSVQIKALKDKVTTLENENNDLKNRVEKLEALIKKLM